MAADTGTKLVLLAGTMTFGNEWLQTHQINWRIPVATVLAGVAVAGVGRLSPRAGTGIGVMALIVAAATPLNGKSPIQELSTVVNGSRVKNKVSTAKVGT